VLLPAASEAEPWELWAVGGEARFLASFKQAVESSQNRKTLLGLPLSEVIALPLWVQETDERQFEEIVALQLEARGLAPRNSEPISDWSVVIREEKRTLLLVAVLPGSVSKELETEVFPAFELSARCYRMPPDALVLWMEQGHLAMAVTRKEGMVYFHAFSEAGLSTRGIQNIVCSLATLEMQAITETVREIVLWTVLSPAEITALRSALGLPLLEGERPSPTLPSEAWNLTPARVNEVKRQRQARRWQVRAALLVLTLILLVVAALGLRLFLIARDVRQLQAWQDAHAGALQSFQDTRASWQDLAPVVDTNSYPLEVLLHVSESLPADQVHLTLFEEEGSHLLIKAEAKNLTAGFQFFDQLKKNQHLASYTWVMAQPHSLANDITQLQIEGTYATHD
jgi:hypothetical protein